MSFFDYHWPWPESHTPALGIKEGDASGPVYFYELPLSYIEVKDVFGIPDRIIDFLDENSPSKSKHRICDYFEEIYSAQTNLIVRVEPTNLHLANPYTNFVVQVSFSNGTDRLVVLAKNDIKLRDNLAVVSGEKLRASKSRREMVDLGMFQGFGHWGPPELVELEPGDFYVHQCELHNSVMRGVSWNDRNADLYVAFYGWQNEYRTLNYMISEFPKELHPYVWTKPVTSMPIRVEFDMTGQERQRHRYQRKLLSN